MESAWFLTTPWSGNVAPVCDNIRVRPRLRLRTQRTIHFQPSVQAKWYRPYQEDFGSLL